jgi:hypothetical protein
MSVKPAERRHEAAVPGRLVWERERFMMALDE